MTAYEVRLTAPDCPFTAGDPPRTCRGCGADLPRRRDGKPWANRVWCSDGCTKAWQREHVWLFARQAVLLRDDRRCVRRDRHEPEETVRHDLAEWAAAIRVELDTPDLYRIDRARWSATVDARRRLDREFQRRVGMLDLEVNHITPRRGGGYTAGCHHHLDNLETLCRPHHVEETRRQRHGLPTWRQDPRPPDLLLTLRKAPRWT